jgi:hypothetical protein
MSARQQQATEFMQLLQQPQAIRPRYWAAHGFLTQHKQHMAALAATGDVSPQLQSALNTTFAALPCTNAFAETCLKALNSVGTPSMSEALLHATARFICNKPWEYADVDDEGLAEHR